MAFMVNTCDSRSLGSTSFDIVTYSSIHTAYLMQSEGQTHNKHLSHKFGLFSLNFCYLF